MSSKIIATSNSMFWTDKGLKKPFELEVDDSILGADTSGDICWRKVVHRPSCREKASCYDIITDSTEIHAPQGIVLCTQTLDRKFGKIEEINIQDKLRIISNPAYIWEKWNCKKDGVFSDDTAFLLGLAYRKVVVSQDRVVIRIPTEKIETVATTVERRLSQIGLSRAEVTTEHGPFVGKRKPPWGWLIINSQSLTNLIKSVLGDAREPPLVVRADLRLYQSYVKGLMEVLGRKEYEYTHFELFLDEYVARKLLYNIFFLYAIECRTNARPSYSPDKIVISVRSLELERISSASIPGVRGKRSVSKVKWMTDYTSTVQYVPVEGTNWSPIVDLVYSL